jgi:multiple sugar transport system permease protein
MSKTLRKLATGLGFLAPNLLGFLLFGLIPLVVSFAMVFTNWDVLRHNMFTDERVQFVGFENFRRLFAERDFMQYFGNTMFFMLGIPLGMAGSLGAALLLYRDMEGPGRKIWKWMLCTAVFTGSLLVLLAVGMGATATTLCLMVLGATILIGGSAGGSVVHRSIFYSPSFCAGVAIFILWKKMYSPVNGPINNALAPLLGRLQRGVLAVPEEWVRAGSLVCAACVALLVFLRVRRILRDWREGEAGTASVAVALALLAVPVAFALVWTPTALAGWLVLATGIGAALFTAVVLARGRLYPCRPDYGMSITAIMAGGVASLACALLGLSLVFDGLPAMCRKGLEAPNWLGAYHWAKPAIMLMGLWSAIGSGNMLLYLAGLSNISPELYEAADIDGASSRQRFWHITWPQLAPVTFFIFVMSVIGGLQGGFDTARTMTAGGPAGATTTLSYFIYTEGFNTGRLGYASAASWALFAMVFAATVVNWKFGNKSTAE